MRVKQLTMLAVIGLFATTVWSGEEMHHTMKIAIVEADGDSETRIELNSDDLGFSLHEMQVGEYRSIVDKEGRSILVTRGEENFTFEVDGKTIEMPVFGGHDVDVRVMHDGMAPMAMGMEGVMIVSEKEIDEATQQIIRTALESAGHENVQFAGGHEGGPHRVHVIRKVVEVTD